MTGQVHEIYAVKFGENRTGVRGHFFHGSAADPHDEPMRLDYFVWLIRSAHQDIVLDVGFTRQTAERRVRDHWQEPSEALARLGVDCVTVPWVILSHLHYDHTGDIASFPGARFVVQEAEMAFWTGPYASRHEFRRAIEPADITTLVGYGLDGRIQFVDGTREIVDGVWVHGVGGHTPGTQVTRVRTERGHVVLAADASHLYANVEADAPFAVFTDLIGMYRTFDVMNDLASAPDLVVPGHDPELFNRFDAVPGHEGVVLRIA